MYVNNESAIKIITQMKMNALPEPAGCRPAQGTGKTMWMNDPEAAMAHLCRLRR